MAARFTADEQRLGIAIRIDPIHRAVEAIDGLTTYAHRSMDRTHPFHGWLADGPEKTIPHPFPDNRTITIGGQPSGTVQGMQASTIQCEGCGMPVGTIYFLS